MYTMEITNMGSATFRIAAIIISITCIFYTLLMQRKERERSRLFLMLLSIILIDAVSGLFSSLIAGVNLATNTKLILIHTLQMIYFITHFALIFVFFKYIVFVCNLKYIYDEKKMKSFGIPIIVLELLLITNPITGICFSIDKNYVFHRNIGIYAAYIVSTLYFIQCIVILVRYWHTINQLKKLAMFYFLSLAVVGIIIQLIFPDIVSELLCESIGLMGLMIMIEKEDDKIDIITSAYNRSALINDLNVFINMKIPIKIICIRIDNSDSYRRIAGYENFDDILVEITNFLIEIAHENNVYKDGDASFFIICPNFSNKQMKNLAHTIDSRFKMGFSSDSGSLTLVENILCASFPEKLVTSDDILLLADAPLEDVEQNIFINDELDFLLRNIAIEKAISHGIAAQSFHVYYQPIYGKKCGCIKAMQALLKLNDSSLGELNYNEFMPIAERAGFADTLESKMLESIFRFVGESLNKTISFDFVLIHLMSVKVVNKSLVETVMGLKYKYNIDPSKIAFDIDDSILNFGNENLSYVLNEFYNAGFSLFLGNYDISNLGQNETILSRFRGVVLTAWKFLDETYIKQGQLVLENRTDMLSQLEKEVIITGIDNESFLEEITGTTAKYMSGKNLSAPLTKEEIIDRFLKEDKITLASES